MRYILSIALRNLRRHKLRTLLSITAIIIAVIVGIFYRSILIAYSESTFENFIQLESGHVRLVDEEYARRERVLSLQYPVDGFTGEGLEAMMDSFNEDEAISGMLPRLRFPAFYAEGDEMEHMLGWGVDIGRETEEINFDRHLAEGRLPEADTREIAVGHSLLEKLNREVGDTITLLYNTSYNSLQGSTFTITGKIDTGLPYFDANIFVTPLDQAQYILDMPDQATELLLFGSDRDQDSPIVSAVNTRLETAGGIEKYQLTSWRDSGGIVQWLMAYQRIIFVVMAGIVFLASLIIINTLMMVIKERKKEIGTMASLGLKDKEIVMLFTFEGALMGILGSVIGAIIGGGLTAYFSVAGLDFTDVMGSMGDSTLIDSVVFPTFSLENLLVAMILGIIVSTLACIIPARQAAKVEPSEAMRDLK